MTGHLIQLSFNLIGVYFLYGYKDTISKILFNLNGICVCYELFRIIEKLVV
jgi:hypothetical protein